MGNAGGLYCSLGFDYGFCKNHSIGIETTFYGDEGQHDHYSGANSPNNRPSDIYTGTKKAIYLNYRYYLNLKRVRENAGIAFYVGALARYGQGSYSWSIGYSSDGILSSKIEYYSCGALIGLFYKFKKKNRFGVDFNVGTLYDNKTVDNTYLRQPLSTYGQFVTCDLCSSPL